MRTYHLVEPGRILQAVSYFNQRAFFVILVGSDVVQFDCQFLYVGSKMVYCFQPVSKVTKNKKKTLNSFYKVKQERGDNGRFVGNGFLIVREILSVEMLCLIHIILEQNCMLCPN